MVLQVLEIYVPCREVIAKGEGSRERILPLGCVCVFKGCVHFCSSSCCSNQVLRNECVQIADRVPL